MNADSLLPVVLPADAGAARPFRRAAGFLFVAILLPLTAALLGQILNADDDALANLVALPAIGVAKTPLGRYDPPGQERGATSPLLLEGEQVGAALRTQPGVKPVFVSIGHRTDLDTACRYVLALARDHRLPETTRQADRLARSTLRSTTP